jgi:hypothetical protein
MPTEPPPELDDLLYFKMAGRASRDPAFRAALFAGVKAALSAYFGRAISLAGLSDEARAEWELAVKQARGRYSSR